MDWRGRGRDGSDLPRSAECGGVDLPDSDLFLLLAELASGWHSTAAVYFTTVIPWRQTLLLSGH